MSSFPRAAAAYFAVQASAVAAWWGLLLACPPARGAFLQSGEGALLAFLLPDLLLLAAGSALAAWLCLRAGPFTLPVLWLQAGAVAYAELYCFGLALTTGRGWLGVILMAPALFFTAALAALLSFRTADLFRPAPPAADRNNLLKTALQSAVVWGLTLCLLPLVLLEMERRCGLPRWSFPGQPAAGALLFLGMSALNVWCGVTMARQGRGTPLPRAAPRRLVCSGPYALLRNPMAVAGLGQGAAVALGTGSPVIAGYVLLGAVFWQGFVRPLEEEDLEARFGEEFRRYRGAVSCWWPRRGTATRRRGVRTIPGREGTGSPPP